jgi:hypothetical protein
MALDVEEVLGVFTEFVAAFREDPVKAGVYARLCFPELVQMAYDDEFRERFRSVLVEDWDYFDQCESPEGMAAAVPHLLVSLFKALADEVDTMPPT